MITDLRDLEPLLGQYDPGLILVGPVLSFSIGGYRYFFVAANGSQVYQAIGLGHFENEADAESLRADIIAIVKTLFTEMLSFDNHYEMAHAANTRWPNEETAKVLASATLLTSGAVARDGSIDDNGHAPVVPGDSGEPPVDDVAPEPVDRTNEAVPRSALPWVLDETPQSLSTPNMSAGAPSVPGGADHPPATPQQGHAGRHDADIAAISKALRPSYQPQSPPKQPAATSSSVLSRDRAVGEQQGQTEDLGNLLAILASVRRPDLDQNDVAAIVRAIDPPDRPQSVRWLAVGGARRLASLVLLLFAVGGAALLTRAILRPSTPPIAHEVGTTAPPATATAPSSIPAQQTASIKPAQVEPSPPAMAPSPPAPQPSAGASIQARTGPDPSSAQQAISNAPTPRVEPAPAMASSPPAPQPSSGRVSPQAKTVPGPRPEQRAMTNEQPQQVEPAPAMMAPSPSSSQPSGGASTQAEAVPDSRPEQQAMTSGPAQKVEPAPAAMAPSSPAPQPSSVVSTQAKTVPGPRPEQRAMTNEPAPAVMAHSPSSPQPSGGASTQAEAVPDSHPQQQAKSNGPAPKVEPAPAAMAPSSPAPQPSSVVSTQAKTVPGPRPEQRAMTNEPAPAVMAPSPSSPQPSGGASIQAEAVPDSHPQQQAKSNGPAPKVEPAPAAMPPSRPAPQSSGGANIQAKAAPDSSAEHHAIASVSGAQSPPAQGDSTALRLDPQEITTLIDRGSAYLKSGDLASARLLLRRAAEAGSAEAALMFGSTFDPLFIRQLGAIGVQPDIARARQWYQKAAELGSDAASQRLANLKDQ